MQGYFILNGKDIQRIFFVREGGSCSMMQVLVIGFLILITGINADSIFGCKIQLVNPTPHNETNGPIVTDLGTQNLTLKCTATNLPRNDLTIYWEKNGGNITNRNTTEEVIRQTAKWTSFLILRKVSQSTAGTYGCVVRGGEKCSIDIQTGEAPRIIDQPTGLFTPALQILTIGDTKVFHCYASGLPSPRVYWLKDGRIINDGDSNGSYRVENKDGGLDLTIISAQVSHAGNYTCRAENRMGRAEHYIWVTLSARMLSVEPEVKAVHPVVIVDEGDAANLSCTATHVLPAYTIAYWVYNDTRLDSHMSYDNAVQPITLTFSLHVRNVTKHGTGNYTCVTITHIGAGSALITLSTRDETYRLTNRKKTPPSARTMVITIAASTGLLLGIAAAGIARYLRRKRKEKLMHSICNQLEFQYDVFITYSGKDYSWVRDELIPLLDKNDLHYSIHCRDFEIGKAILDNMAEFIYKSRKIIAVMSSNYMSSKFCRGELDMALYRSAEAGDGSLILVRLDRIDKKKLPRSVRNKTFLDYADKNERKVWQQRLIKHLKTPLVMMSPSTSEELSSIPIIRQENGRTGKGTLY